MTPFMQMVDDVLHERGLSPVPLTSPGEVRLVGEALHRQVELRAAAEQFVSEGNALLREHGSLLTLVDQLSEHELAFTVSFGHARAEVVTSVSGHHAWGCLVLDGHDRQAVELVDPDALSMLILRMIASERPATSGV